ncbi:RHO1 GDP-GTP exchange protein 2, partial [Linderina pennispora]
RAQLIKDVPSIDAGDDDDDDDEEEDIDGNDARTLTPAGAPIGDLRVNGVFVMLTDCYSPTCSSSQPCYSVTCPRQRSQQDHLRKTAKKNVAAEMKNEKNWSKSVPKEIVASVTRKELDRQERIFEIFNGERNYVHDLCVVRDLFMRPLHNSDVIDESRRKNFITKVFKNALAILAENSGFQRALEKRQNENYICYQIGDIFTPFVQRLEPYLEYGANASYSKHFLDAEKKQNRKLVDFLEKTSRNPECRKLNIQHFMALPTTRLARYPLLLREVLKYTPEGHPDREAIPYAISRIEAMLQRINIEAGKSSNRLRLYYVDEMLMCSSSDRNDLRLTDDQRKLVRDGELRKRGGNDNSKIKVLLLDHMLLMCKCKLDPNTSAEKYTIYKHPIPLQLLTICNPEDPTSMRPRMAARRDSQSAPMSPGGTIGVGRSKSMGTVATQTQQASPAPLDATPTSATALTVNDDAKKYTFPLQITHLGRRGFTVTLYASQLAERDKWYQKIEQQQMELMERHRKFEMVPVACQFPPGIRVNTADVYDHGR